MALIMKNLLVKTLLTSANDVVYTVPAGKAALVKSIILTNKTGSSVTVHVTLKTSANTQVYLWPSGVQIAANTRISISDEITMSYVTAQGDRLEIWAGTGSAIDAVISGIERDV